MYNIIRYPDAYKIVTEGGSPEDSRIEFNLKEESLEVILTAKKDLPKVVILRWKVRTDGPVRICGDAWERTYGDSEWRGIIPEREMPWYFMLENSCSVFGFGVMVRPSSICHWQFDREGITLVLDVRNGTRGVRLDGRRLSAATVVYKEYRGHDAFGASCRFCSVMSPDPILPEEPVYGGNNWYYAYGKSSHDEMLSDAEYISGLSKGLENRPYMVADDGWEPNSLCGPFDRGGKNFPDMPGLMRGMKDVGAKPGLWIRALLDAGTDIPEECHLRGEKRTLDPTHPFVRKRLSETVSRIAGWGCMLLKHDFSEFDITGIWGKDGERGLIPDNLNWGFYDPSVTTAEAAKGIYEDIYRASGNMVIIGCNCINHLCPGFVHLNRIGDDTSGRQWERTRYMGINTLAFRLPQNRKFFCADADCVGITADVPWELNRQWMDLLSRSGTPLFLSCRRKDINTEMEEDIKSALARASVQKDTLVPLDWQETGCPARWLSNGKEIKYKWMEKLGTGRLI